MFIIFWGGFFIMKAIRLLSVFLAACFLLCMLPAKAEAETATTVTKATVVSRLNYLINKLNGIWKNDKVNSG